MAHGKGRDHPQAVPPIAQPVDGREREQEQNVVHRLEIGNVAEAEGDVGGELAHGALPRAASIAAECCSSCGSTVPSESARSIAARASRSRCDLWSAQASRSKPYTSRRVRSSSCTLRSTSGTRRPWSRRK